MSASALTFDEAVRALVAQTGLARDRAEAIIRADGRWVVSTHKGRIATQERLRSELAGRIRPGAYGERLAHGVRLVLPVAPRTKKNHGRAFGIRQSAAYVHFRERVAELVTPLRAHLRLPLPDGRYNLAAVYYVDRYGERADLVGLHQGLFDALQDAGVVTDDWQFRTSDGSRIVFGDERPRVELTITNLPQE